MIEQFFVILLIGKLVMYLARKAPYMRWVTFFRELFSCELCLGVWVYGLLAFLFGFYLPSGTRYIPLISEFITGAILSFVMWLLTDGWNSKFRVMYLE